LIIKAVAIWLIANIKGSHLKIKFATFYEIRRQSVSKSDMHQLEFWPEKWINCHSFEHLRHFNKLEPIVRIAEFLPTSLAS
jgi:hypothetical protein